MKIIIHDYSGHPFQIQLSRSLAMRGHIVNHIYSKSFQSPKGTLTLNSDDPENFKITGISLKKVFKKDSFVKRRFQEIEYGHLLAEKISEIHPDIIISSNTPLDSQIIAMKTCKRLNIKFIIWLQDINSIAITKIVGKKIPIFGFLVGVYYRYLEKYLLAQSDGVVLITDDFIPILKKWAMDDKKLFVIPNWAPIEDIHIVEKSNPWSIKIGIDKKFCFLYSGTIAMKHNPEILVKLALNFKDNDRVRVVVVSEGTAADWLKKQKEVLRLHNFIILDFQPFDELPNMFGAADVLIGILEPDAGFFSVPSKVLTYLCSNKPILLSVPLENLAARIVDENKAGIAIQPNDEEAFVNSATTLFKNENLRKEMGHSGLLYAEANFNIENITNSFENILKNICNIIN